MGREIEIKIPVSYEAYNFIRDVMSGLAFADGVTVVSGGMERILKSDEYYSRYKTRAESKAAGEPQVIRIRCESAPGENAARALRAFFCIKRKSIENGIELNREDETFVENPEVIRDILNLSGYHKFFEKKKDAYSVHCTSTVLNGADFHLELEVVNGLKYVEIEVTQEGLPADEVRSSLEKFVAQLGLDASKRDSRSWMEIIQADL